MRANSHRTCGQLSSRIRWSHFSSQSPFQDDSSSLAIVGHIVRADFLSLAGCSADVVFFFFIPSMRYLVSGSFFMCDGLPL